MPIKSGKNSMSLKMDVSEVMKALQELQNNVNQGLLDNAKEAADLLEHDAKENAPWQDVTGNARHGLTGFTEKNAQGVSVGLASTVPYAEQLEFAQSGRRAIVQPTLIKNANQVLEILTKDVLK